MLPEAWWTVLQEPTYSRVEPDLLPPLPMNLVGSLAWLSQIPPLDQESNILRTDQAARPLSPDLPDWLSAQGLPPMLIPQPLAELADGPDLLSGIASVTLCFVDLGDRVAAVDESAGGGWLVRFLSDSQMVRSWLLHIEPTGTHRVVTTPAWIGYDVPEEPDEPYPVPDARLSLADLHRLDVETCAPDLNSFLVRFWLENEAWRGLHGATITSQAQTYLDEWQRLSR